jgi:hypothetical protein
MSRREFLFWVACLLLARSLASPAGESVYQWLAAVPQALASHSAFFYLGWYAVFHLLFQSSSERQPMWLDVALALSVCLFIWAPVHSAVWISATAMAACLLATSAGDAKLRAAAVVLLALAVNGLWGPRLFDIFEFQFLRVDAALVGTALSLTLDNVRWNDTILGTVGGHSIVVFGACSSFHNISLGLLCWIALTKLARVEWMRSDIVFAALVCAAVVLLNACRLYLMALDGRTFTYWHEGPGAELFAWSTSLTVLFISLWGALQTRRAT